MLVLDAFEGAKLSELIVPLCEYNLDIENIGLENGTVYVPINLTGNNMVEEFEKSGNTVRYYTDEEDLMKIRSIQV